MQLSPHACRSPLVTAYVNGRGKVTKLPLLPPRSSVPRPRAVPSPLRTTPGKGWPEWVPSQSRALIDTVPRTCQKLSGPLRD